LAMTLAEFSPVFRSRLGAVSTNGESFVVKNTNTLQDTAVKESVTTNV
jgi:hypothetical protein